MIQYFFTKQFLMFLFVSGLAALLHWLARIFLSVWLPFYWAVVFAYFIGMSSAFTLNRIFVFPKATKPMPQQARDFIFVNILFFPLVFFVSIQINNWLKSMGMLNHSEELSHGLALFLPMLATFLIYKFFSFKEKYESS